MLKYFKGIIARGKPIKEYFEGIITSWLIAIFSIVLSITGILIAIFFGRNNFFKYLKNCLIGSVKGFI